jgi:hypothetical protein
MKAVLLVATQYLRGRHNLHSSITNKEGRNTMKLYPGEHPLIKGDEEFGAIECGKCGSHSFQKSGCFEDKSVSARCSICGEIYEFFIEPNKNSKNRFIQCLS